MATPATLTFPSSKSRKNSVSRTFLRSRFSYKSIGKSKCRSTIPPVCSRSIRSATDSFIGFFRGGLALAVVGWKHGPPDAFERFLFAQLEDMQEPYLRAVSDCFLQRDFRFHVLKR